MKKLYGIQLYLINMPPVSTLFPYTTLFRSDDRTLVIENRLQLVAARLCEVALRLEYLEVGRCPRRELPLLGGEPLFRELARRADRKSTRLNSSHPSISYAVFCLKKKMNVRL